MTTLKNDEAVVVPADGAREASMGRTAQLRTLADALAALEAQVAAEAPFDCPTAFKALALRTDGTLTRGQNGLRMTYRVFGSLLRSYCAPPRNVAACLYRLSVSQGSAEAEAASSPRAAAYNDYLAQGRGRHADDVVVLRTRRLPRADGTRVPVVVGAVTESHSLTASDDRVFVAKLREVLTSDEQQAMRATAYRGVEVTELRAVVPSTRVELAPGEWWSGYLAVRNSEVGAASWSVSAGLVREMDDASFAAAKSLGFEGSQTLAVETNARTGVHRGDAGPKVQDALVSAKALLATLTEDAGALASAETTRPTEWVVGRLAAAMRKVGAGEETTEELCAAAAMLAPKGARFTSAEVVSFLGLAMGRLTRRGQTYPLERLAGRVLLEGVDAALERLAEVADTDAAE